VIRHNSPNCVLGFRTRARHTGKKKRRPKLSTRAEKGEEKKKAPRGKEKRPRNFVMPKFQMCSSASLFTEEGGKKKSQKTLASGVRCTSSILDPMRANTSPTAYRGGGGGIEKEQFRVGDTRKRGGGKRGRGWGTRRGFFSSQDLFVWEERGETGRDGWVDGGGRKKKENPSASVQ